MNLNQVTLPVVDVERAIAFYQLLGHKLIVKALPQYSRFECPEGDATLSVHHVDEMPKTPCISIYFEVKDLDETVGALVAIGITFDELPNDKSWLWREARLRDSDNNNLILFFGSVSVIQMSYIY